MVSRVSTMSEAEQCIKRIQSHRGVKSVFVINNRGQTIKSSVNNPEEERRYAGLISELTKKTQSMVRELDSEVSWLVGDAFGHGAQSCVCWCRIRSSF